ncbi:MAG: hypothetical protein JSR18_01860 [Proteobacteria bacterium]|nr:hypothetical protein [Pseudomonadota bacterium]
MAREPAVPVRCLTPGPGGYLHRFHDTSPFSPSGRYVAMTRLAAEDRLPVPGDVAEVAIADLESGAVRTVAHTRGADTQVGAHVQWGADDDTLFFNDVDTATWQPFGVRLAVSAGTRQRLAGTVYNVAPDARTSVGPSLVRIGATQAGYGVVVPPERVPRHLGAPDDDGVHVTDLGTGATHVLASTAAMVAATFARDELAELAAQGGGGFYGFHAKWNPQGTRIMFMLRFAPARPNARWLSNVITMNADGSGIARAIGYRQWMRGGHHPNWCPDGEHLLMNLNPDGRGLRFVHVRHDGANLRMLDADIPGSGHPTMHPDGVHVLTDAYAASARAALPSIHAHADGTTPLRWIDVAASRERELLRIGTVTAFTGPRDELRVDAHPAWDRDFRRIAFNASPDGTRRVFVADLATIVGA